jgi:hypothetical protein
VRHFGAPQYVLLEGARDRGDIDISSNGRRSDARETPLGARCLEISVAHAGNKGGDQTVRHWIMVGLTSAPSRRCVLRTTRPFGGDVLIVPHVRSLRVCQTIVEDRSVRGGSAKSDAAA